MAAVLSPPVSQAQAMAYWQVLQLDKRMRQIQNQLDYFEILATFWPFPNMLNRMERLGQELQSLEREKNRLMGNVHQASQGL